MALFVHPTRSIIRGNICAKLTSIIIKAIQNSCLLHSNSLAHGFQWLSRSTVYFWHGLTEFGSQLIWIAHDGELLDRFFGQDELRSREPDCC